MGINRPFDDHSQERIRFESEAVMVRFLQQYETGIGDYIKERDLWLKEIDIESIFIELKNRRKKKAR